MKSKITELSHALRDLHKRFLENERLHAEKYLERSLSLYDFLHLLLQDEGFAWLRPFSALIADLDAFADEAEEISAEDMLRYQAQVNEVLQNPAVAARYQQYLNEDGAFVLLHARLTRALLVLSE